MEMHYCMITLGSNLDQYTVAKGEFLNLRVVLRIAWWKTLKGKDLFALLA